MDMNSGEASCVDVERIERPAGRHEKPVSVLTAKTQVGASLGKIDMHHWCSGWIEDAHAIEAFAGAPAAP
jgi:hypothetical protein